jgi:prepilin-type N-terminal cleavage/methylation domain-containing protein
VKGAPRKSNCEAASGFTLIELLTVVAIMVTVVGLAVPAFTSIGSANLLDASGNRAVNLINFAREDAMSKNAMTALVVLTSPQNSAYRTLAVMELPNGSTVWNQVSAWETLSSGAMIDPGPDNNSTHIPFPYLFNFTRSTVPAGTAGVPRTAFPSIQYGGATVQSYQYEVFLPNGSLLSGSSATIRLAEGFISSGNTATYTRPDPHGGGPANYYNITILGATGRTKIDRP